MASGCLIVLVEESAAMDSPVARAADVTSVGSFDAPRKSKAEGVATVLNSFIGSLAGKVDCDLAVLGYRTDEAGNLDVGCRWAGALTGRDLVSSAEVASHPVTVEQRQEKSPGPGGIIDEVSVDFPIWYQPQLGNKAPQIAAFQRCRELLGQRTDDACAPIIVNIFASSSADGNPLMAVKDILALDCGGGAPIVLQAHLGSADSVPATLYPANRAYLSPGPMRDLMDRASVLPEHLANALREEDVTINENARGMIYDAKLMELRQLLSLTKTHFESVQIQPGSELAEAAMPTSDDAGPSGTAAKPATAATATGEEVPDASSGEDLEQLTPVDDSRSALCVSPETPALIAFVLDRSVDDPFGGNLDNVCSRLLTKLNETLERIAKSGRGSIDVAVISYGSDAAGEVDVRTTFDGPLAFEFLRDNELVDSALRVEETMEETPDGVGGILTIPRRKHIFVDVEPATALTPTEPFQRLAEMISNWCSDHPNSKLPPVILHMTRGRFDENELATAIDSIRSAAADTQPVVYHLIVTEVPHPCVAYADSDESFQDENLKAIWRHTSLLYGQDAVDRPDINDSSRGVVVNGDFDLLLDAIERATVTP